MMELTQRELSPGVSLTALQTDKFKTSLLSFTFMAPLSAETAAENALLPAVLRRGSRNHPDLLSMAAALDDLYGGSIEPLVRKKGETQCIGFLSSFLNDSYLPDQNKVLDASLSLMAELVLEPAGENGHFDPGYLESEKQNLINRIKSRMNDKQQYAMYRLIRLMFEGEVYGVDKLGEEADVSRITNDSLKTRYETLRNTCPITFFYCGTEPVDRVEEAIKAAFAPLLNKERNQAALSETNVVLPQQPRYFEEQMDITQGKLTMGFRAGAPCVKPAEAATAMVLNAIFGGSTNSKLFLNVREKLSLCYYASSLFDRQMGVMLLSSGIAFDQYEKARDEILAQLDDCRKGKISEEEFQSATSFVTNQLCLTADSQGMLEDYWLSQAALHTKNTTKALEKAVKAITPEDVQKLAQSLVLDSVYFLQGKEGAES